MPLEIPVDHLVKFEDLMPDRLAYEFLKAGNITLTPLGLLKLRPDLAGSEDTARRMLKRSAVTEIERLKAIPSLQRYGLMVVEFKAKNNGRTCTHQHLFMLDEEVEAVTAGNTNLKMAVSKAPLGDWIALLDKNWDQ